MADKGQGSDQVDPNEQTADEYLSKLANSILSKEKRSRPGGGGPNETPPPTQQRTGKNDTRSDVQTPPPEARDHRPTDGRTHQHASPPHSEWVRKVDVHDARGSFLPGTILLFEDGSVGLFKETNAEKDYDIVYMLRNSGRVAAQGMPLYNYDVEPIGRLSHVCFESVSKTNQWERDMMVFHLLRYKDRTHIPEIVRQEQIHSPASGETFSKWDVKKLDTSEPIAEETQKPKLIRGRQLTIQFGAQQRWPAVYWGRDELGHVVAHNTHDKWALMHLDLERFKDSIVFHEIVDDDTVQKMERDFAAAS